LIGNTLNLSENQTGKVQKGNTVWKQSEIGLSVIVASVKSLSTPGKVLEIVVNFGQYLIKRFRTGLI